MDSGIKAWIILGGILLVAGALSTVHCGAAEPTTKTATAEVVRITGQQAEIAQEYDKLAKALQEGQQRLIWLKGQYDGLEALKTSITSGTATVRKEATK